MINCGDKYIQKVMKEKESLQTVAEPSEGRTTQINYQDKSDKWEERYYSKSKPNRTLAVAKKAITR